MRPVIQHGALAAAIAAAPAIGRAQHDVVSIPRSVVRTVGEILPERVNAGAAMVASVYSANFEVIAPCRISALFVHEGAGYRNSVGYFTYREKPGGGYEILDADLLFPDVSRPPLPVGCRAWLRDRNGTPRTFDAGDRVGFFLVANGWNDEPAIKAWTFAHPGIPADDPAKNAAIGQGCYTSIPALNPEAATGDDDVAGHVAMVRVAGVPGFLDGRDFFVSGFEDLDRRTRSDDDFNDCVFLIDVDPGAAVKHGAYPFASGDPDKDGVEGLLDLFPTDAQRAYISRFPSRGYMVLAYEDLYPTGTDTDYDDAVFAFAFEFATDSRNRVKDLLADYHMIARGASFEHSFGMHMPGLRNDATGSVKLQLWRSGEASPMPIETHDLSDVVHAYSRRIDRIIPSTRAALPRAAPNTPFANTELNYPWQPAASARILIEFDRTAKHKHLGSPPYDPYLVASVPDMGEADIHLPGWPGFPERPPVFPKEKGKNAFITEEGNPWALLLPTSWRYPLEGVPMRVAYPEYEAWRDSKGQDFKQWYLNPTTEPDKISPPIEELIPRRDWTLQPPRAGR